MGRMHGEGKGKSGSCLPYYRRAPSWLQVKAEELEEKVCKLARKGVPPAQIGVVLRDAQGIGQVQWITKRKICAILKLNGLQPKIPYDLFCLIKCAVRKRKHFSKNKKDKLCKSHIIRTEAKILRLVRYYKKKGVISNSFRYDPESAEALISAM